MTHIERAKAMVAAAVQEARKLTPEERRKVREAAQRDQAIRNWEREQTR